VPEHAAEPDPADHLALVPGRVVPGRSVAQQSVSQSLVRPFQSVVFEVLCHQMVQMLQPNRDYVVQALAPQRLDLPLHMRVAQRRLHRPSF
jgi:hypothetical protein